MIKRVRGRSRCPYQVSFKSVALLCSALSLAGCGSNSGSGNDTAAGSASGAGTSGSNGPGPSAGSSGVGGAPSATCTTSALPGELVKVPGGDFTMGCNDAIDADCSDDEKPMHIVSLAAFEIGRTEVTQSEYTACLGDTVCTPPTCDWNCDDASFPASCVSWAQADAYCVWAERRLPTEAEWEKAARGDQGNKYPWGDSEPDCTLVNMAGCGDQALATGSFAAGASPYGALDMAGSMVEFVADWYDQAYYESSPAADPTGPLSGTRYGGRGGGFKSDAEYLRTAKRDWYDPTDAGASLGFRCAR